MDILAPNGIQLLEEAKNITPSTMAVKSPWHSIKQDVYHNNTECNTGNNIERENIRQGTGGKRHCSECARLRK
jgi:hypothetical protein